MEKDIFDIFREQQHELDEMPSGRVWQKLEKKLETAPVKKHGVVRFLPLSVAAAIFIVVFMGSLAAVIILRLNHENEGAIVTKNPDGTDMGTDSDYVFTETPETGAPETDELSKKTELNGTAVAPIEDLAEQPSGYVDKAEPVQPSSTAPDEPSTVSSGSVTAADDASDFVEEESLSVSKESKKAEKTARIEKDDTYAAKSKVATADVKAAPASKTAPGSAAPAKKPALDANKNIPSPNNVLSQLEGKWLGINNGLTNIEEWKQVDEYNWSGKGYTVANGDTTFTEIMRIGTEGGQTYFIGKFDPFGGTVRIPFSRYDDNRLIFETDSVQVFPNMVTMEINNGQLTTTIQNNDTISPSLSQNQYLSNRNMVKQNKATRKLKKIKK